MLCSFILQFSRVALFPCCTNSMLLFCFMLYSIHVAPFFIVLFSRCTICTFFAFYFVCVCYFIFALILGCTFSVLLCCLLVLFSCCTFLRVVLFFMLMLHLFWCWFMLYSFQVALFPFCTFFMLRSFYVALFSCCTCFRVAFFLYSTFLRDAL